VLDRLIPASLLEQILSAALSPLADPSAHPECFLQQAWQERDIAVLARVRDNIQIEVLDRLTDGSALIELPVRESRRSVAVLKLPEIQAHGIGVA
jgi:hypothetical protein